jgi:hypothetical protein
MKFKVKLQAVILMVVATAAALSAMATSGKEPQWVAASPWFSWNPQTILKGQTVLWSGGISGLGWEFALVTQINNPLTVNILSWQQHIEIYGDIVYCSPCEIINQGLIPADGQLWITFTTWNPQKNNNICYCITPVPFNIYVTGTAQPTASGQYIGRTWGGISAYSVWATSTLTVK